MARLTILLGTSTVLLACLLYLTLTLAALGAQERDLIEHIKSAGYPIQVHKVTTEDSYILTMHRIEHKKLGRNSAEEINQQPVAFLLHGMMKTSASFINQGLNSNFAYSLADAGYDVWLGNTRGNPFSRAHEHLNPDDEVDKIYFFDFGFEEIATNDIPAMIEYITATTGTESIKFIGDAEGATSFLILNSLMPEYNQRFELAVLLNPVGYMNNFPSTELMSAASLIDSFYKLGEELGMLEISSLHRNLPDETLSSQLVFQSVVTYMAYLGGFTPVGTSLKQIVHYGQNIRDKSFKRWDHGQSVNNKVYGAVVPPSYNISGINVETVMYYRMGDSFLDERDVQAMAADMPTASAFRIDETYNPIKYLSDMS